MANTILFPDFLTQALPAFQMLLEWSVSVVLFDFRTTAKSGFSLNLKTPKPLVGELGRALSEAVPEVDRSSKTLDQRHRSCLDSGQSLGLCFFLQPAGDGTEGDRQKGRLDLGVGGHQVANRIWGWIITNRCFM